MVAQSGIQPSKDVKIYNGEFTFLAILWIIINVSVLHPFAEYTKQECVIPCEDNASIRRIPLPTWKPRSLLIPKWRVLISCQKESICSHPE